MPDILLPIRPTFAARIYAREKTIELRRRRPRRVGLSERLYIYETSPIMRVTGWARVIRVGEVSGNRLATGLEQAEWDDYARGAKGPLWGVFFGDVVPATRMRPGAEQLARLGLWPPPQQWRYLTIDQSEQLRVLLDPREGAWINALRAGETTDSDGDRQGG